MDIYSLVVGIFNLVFSIVVPLLGTMAFISAFVLPWLNLRNINSLRKQNDHLVTNINKLSSILRKEGLSIPEDLELTQSNNNFINSPKETKKEKDTEFEKYGKWDSLKKEDIFKQKKKTSISFEQQFGARLPVWVGGIALVLAGFFLVKYSIDNNLLNPAIRIILGGIFGIVLIYVAYCIQKKTNISNGVRISQSLSGAGIAMLYVSTFAATILYQLIPTFLGFCIMGIITAMAVVLSLTHGFPVALLGFIGGFLTPILVGSKDLSTHTLFIYLYFVFSSLMIIIKRKNWWILSIPTIIAVFLWVLFWISGNFVTDDTIWLCLFLIAISITIVISSRLSYEESSSNITNVFKLTSILNYIGLGGSIMLMGLIAGRVGFSLFEWSMFGILAVGSISLAYFNPRLYGFAPIFSMVVTIVMLFAWNTYDINTFTFTLIAFSLLYICSGYFLLWRTHLPVLWAIIIGVSSVSFYLLAYFKLRHTILVESIPFFWGFIAFGIACIIIYIIKNTMEYYRANLQKEYLLAIFTTVTVAFISFGLTIELEREFLSIAFAVEMLVVAWMSNHTKIKALRSICMILALIFAFLLLPQIRLLVELAIYSLIEARLRVQTSIPIVKWPIFQLGLPAIMFIGTSYFLRLDKDGKLVRALELASIGLVAIMIYYLSRHIFHAGSDVLFKKASFFERGIITNILFVYALICFIVGRWFKRIAFSWSGIGLCAVAIFRIIYFDLFIYNPLWSFQKINDWFIFNSLLFPYGLPLLWGSLVGKELSILNMQKWNRRICAIALLLLFTLVSLNIRYFFHNEYLNVGVTTNAEIYAYSVAWLLLGVSLLLVGVLWKDKMLRHASLGMMLLTISKVFLYDAAELEGLYRVFSFFGLGISLLILSWFYTALYLGYRNKLRIKSRARSINVKSKIYPKIFFRNLPV